DQPAQPAHGAVAANGHPSAPARSEPAVAVAPPPAVSAPPVPSVPVAAHPAAYDKLPGEPLFQRPVRLSGFTDQVKLIDASGEKRGFYVTVNKQDGLPTEVFIISGKGGDEANADSEPLGRLVSIALQYGVPAERSEEHTSKLQ